MTGHDLTILQPVVVATGVGLLAIFAHQFYLGRLEKRYVADGLENARQMRKQEEERVKAARARMPGASFPGLLLPTLILAVAGEYSAFAVVAAWIAGAMAVMLHVLPMLNISRTMSSGAVTYGWLLLLIGFAFVPAICWLLVECAVVVFA